MDESTRKDQLIETALTLFSLEGFRAVGIDRLLAEAGVAKMTLYKHFRSKDELVLAVLRRRDERWREWLHRSIEARAGDPRGRLLAVFDALGEWFAEPEFRGCLFINVVAEYGGANEAARELAAEHKRLMAGDLHALARAAGAKDPGTLAEHLALLVEGAIVVAQVCGRSEAARDARTAAEMLLLQHLPAA